MHHKVLLSALAGALLGSTLVGAKQGLQLHSTATAATAAPVRIMPLGTSISYGNSAGVNGGGGDGGFRNGLWNRLVAQGYSVDFVGSQNGPAAPGVDPNHEGHPGWSFPQLTANIDGWLAAYNPQVITMEGDINDILQGASVVTEAANFNTLLTHIFTDIPDAHIVYENFQPVPASNAYAAQGATTSNIQAMNAANQNVAASWAAKGKAIQYIDIYNTSGYNPATDAGPDGLHPNDQGYAKLAASYYNAVAPIVASLQQPTSAPAAPPAVAPALPSCGTGWTCGDVGATTPGGSQTFNGDGSIAVTGGYGDIYGRADQFRFVSQPLNGDGSIGARLVSQTDLAQAGVMLRASADPAAPFYYIETNKAGIAIKVRATQGGPVSLVYDGTNWPRGGVTPASNVYLRIVRSGATYTGQYSTDGATWTTPANATASFPLPATALAGVAVDARSGGQTNTTVFDHLVVGG